MESLKELPEKYKKRFKIIAIIYLPILFIASFILGTWIAKVLQFHIDVFGRILAVTLLVFVYFISIKAVLTKLRERASEEYGDNWKTLKD